MPAATLHKTGEKSKLMVVEFQLPPLEPNLAKKSCTQARVFLVCWNGTWCSQATHHALRLAEDELASLELRKDFSQVFPPSSAMAFPPWQRDEPWRRIRPFLRIAGMLTVPRIPGQLPRNVYRAVHTQEHAQEARHSGQRPILVMPSIGSEAL